MADDEGSGSSTGTTLLAVAAPFVTAGIALLVGIVVGGGIAWVAKPDVMVEKLVPRDLNAEELTAACAPAVAEVTARLTQAEDKVTTLVSDVKTKEARVNELEADIEARKARGAAAGAEFARMKEELAAAKAELETIKVQLVTAIEEKEAVVKELKATVKALDEQKIETKVAQEDALTKGWSAFMSGSQIEICDHGNRKKLGRCRETVEEKVTPFKAKFQHCLRSGQEMPSVHPVEKGVDLPQFSELIDETSNITEGWYVLLCDPTLPEAKGFADERTDDEPNLPPTQPGTTEGEFELDDK